MQHDRLAVQSVVAAGEQVDRVALDVNGYGHTEPVHRDLVVRLRGPIAELEERRCVARLARRKGEHDRRRVVPLDDGLLDAGIEGEERR